MTATLFTIAIFFAIGIYSSFRFLWKLCLPND